MVKPILPPKRSAPRCNHCEAPMVEVCTQDDRLYTCRRCNHAMHADTADRALEAAAPVEETGLTWQEAWEPVETLETYAALWDARAVIERWARQRRAA